MRLHKVVNRIYQGTTYYRWLISIPPKRVRELGWTSGQELEVVVRGSTLWVQPSLRTRPNTKERPSGVAEEMVQRKTLLRR
jgi:antitoxin component of MazEF toxin-antitoxin module